MTASSQTARQAAGKDRLKRTFNFMKALNQVRG
jgi:hypothetical protein